jgi:asparagine synthase (glutamine-hydrolysing)
LIKDFLPRGAAAYRRLRRRLRDPAGGAFVRRVVAARLTYLDTDALLDLRDRVREAESEDRPGSIIEAGCALGGSAIVLASTKSTHRPLLLYDVFGTIPPPSERDGQDVHGRYEVILEGKSDGIHGGRYYGYEPDLIGRVRRSMDEFGVRPDSSNVTFVRGLYEETLYPSGPVAVAHIDCDWYESVKTCLERIWPLVAPGGVAIIDDYDAWSGCRSAVDEFLDVTSDVVPERRGRLHLVKR